MWLTKVSRKAGGATKVEIIQPARQAAIGTRQARLATLYRRSSRVSVWGGDVHFSIDVINYYWPGLRFHLLDFSI